MANVNVGDRVFAGRGADHNHGVVIAICTLGANEGGACVAWDFGTRTWVPRADLKREAPAVTTRLERGMTNPECCAESIREEDARA